MKLINKIFCLFFVLAICLPVMCFPVSAAKKTVEYPSYYGMEYFNINEDGSGFKISESDILDGKLTPLRNKNYIATSLTEDELNSSSYRKKDSKDVYHDRVPYYAFKSEDSYNVANIQDKYFQFLNTLVYYSSTSMLGSDVVTFSSQENYYYLTYFYTYKTNGNLFKYCLTFLSNEPFSFTKKSDGTFKLSNSFSKSTVFSAKEADYDDYTASEYLSNAYSNSSIYFDEYLVSSPLLITAKKDTTIDFEYEIYTNCVNMDLSMFTDTKLNYGLADVKPADAEDFKTKIDVKLTPEFTLDMDRVFDKNTGQNDYFKLEVTNNSDTNIQFCASITEKKSEDFLKPIGGNIIDNIFKIDYEDWEDAYWNYIGDTQYYADCYKKTDKYLGIKHEYTRYAELRKGNFYWILLKPGEKFEDFIYWENVKIKADEEYSFIVDCLPTELDYPTDVFYSMSLNTKIFPFPEELESVRNDYYRDDTLEKYALNFEECVRACNYVFSVESIPRFTTTVRGGNSKITSGWKDTVSQSTNPYYREDTRTGDIIPVGNYQEFNGNLPDVDIDIDNLSVDNIKDYVKYSQNFFTLIRLVFSFVPSLWLLIVFGLTAIIVIAIVRYIRG